MNSYDGRVNTRKELQETDFHLWCRDGSCNHEEDFKKRPKVCPKCGKKVSITHILVS